MRNRKMKNTKHDILNMNRKLLKIIVAMMMAVGTTTVWGQCVITVVSDPTAGYTPTQIVNGSFDDEPWMVFTYQGTTYYTCPDIKDFNSPSDDENGYAQDVVFNGVDGGWNTTERYFWRSSLFEYTNTNNGTHDYIHNSSIPGTDKYVEMNNFHSCMLYQDLTTYSHDVIRWTLKHAVTTGGNDYQPIRVEIGAPNRDGEGHVINASGWADDLNPQINLDSKAIYRYDGVTDKDGNTSTLGFGSASDLQYLRLHNTTSGQRNGWWMAQGIYLIPEGQTVTRFGFISEAATNNMGNLLDDLTFTTIIGGLTASYGENGSIVVSGFWGEDDANKHLIIDINNNPYVVDMTDVGGQHFTVTVPGDCIDGSVTSIAVYHEDYPGAQNTISVNQPISVTAEDVNVVYDGVHSWGITAVVTEPASGYTLTYGTSYNDCNLTVSPTFMEPGTYYVYYTVSAPGYTTAKKKATVFIDKLPFWNDITITPPTPVEGLVYDKHNHTLITAGSATGGKTMVYVEGADNVTAPTEGWSTELPVSRLWGNHYIWYKVLGDDLHNDSDPGVVTAYIQEPPFYNLNLAIDEVGMGEVQVMASTYTEDFEGGELDLTNEWTNDATYPWTRVSKDASYCIKSGNAGVAGSTSSIQATYDFEYGGLISFRYKISSETNYDKGYFEIDGNAKINGISGNGSWLTGTYAVTAGTHTFRWRYTKDSSVNSNDDAFYIDDIVILEELPFASPIEFEEGTIVNLSATANTGYVFANWTLGDNVISTNLPLIFTVTEAATITASFKERLWVSFKSGTEDVSDWSLSHSAAQSGQTVTVTNNGTRTVMSVSVSRNIFSTVEINSSNYSTAITSFNNTQRSKLLFTGNVSENLTLTRAEGEIDLNGHSAHILYTQNNQPDYSLTIKNGTITGEIDGAGGWNDWFCGTLIFENVTINGSLWTDGHNVIIKSGTYNAVNNYKRDDTPGTVTIYGGNISAFNTTGVSAPTYHGAYTLYGGKYAFDPRDITACTVNIPTGYAVVENTDSDSSTYPWKVVNTDSSYAVEFENFHLTEVVKDHQWTFTMPPYDVMVEVVYDFQGHGTEDEPYLIPSTEVWNRLAAKVNAGNNYAGVYFRQTADISGVTTMVGTNTYRFAGTYDGGGYTMNVNLSGGNYTAPFSYISGATIKNVHTTGTVTSNGRFASGIVGAGWDGNSVINCRSSVNITGTYDGDASNGTVVGIFWNSINTVEGCLFDGSITTTTTTRWSGILGWTEEGSTTISNCLFKPSDLSISNTEGSATISRGISYINTNCYYTQQMGTAQGNQAYSVTGGTGVTVAAAGTPTVSYDVSKLDFYGTNGFAFNGVPYGGQDDVISLNLSGAKHYTATTGTLSGTANPYSLTMAAANSVINFVPVASVTTSSSIISYYATLASAVSAWEANSTLTLLANVETSSTITVSNTCTLDLNGYGIRKTGSGAVMAINWGGNLTLNDSDPTAEHHFDVNANNVASLNEASGTLTIYGGYITGGSNNYGGAIDVANSGVDFQNGPSLTMNGGTLIGNSGTVGGVCVSRDTKDYYNTFTMNGGAICYNDQIGVGVYPQGTFHMNGGVVHHNNGIGVKMWNSKLLTLNDAVITDNNGWGIQVDTRRAAIQVQGRTIVSGNNQYDICFDRSGDGSRALSIVGTLHSEARMGISKINSNTPNPFTDGLDGRGNTSNFFSNDANYIVGRNTSGEAYLHVPYTVTYDGNGNDGGTVPTDANTYAGGVAVTILSGVPTRTGYAFTGWLNSLDGITYAAGAEFTITGNTTLTAQWSINNYTISATANPTECGTVTGDGNYNHFASCTLTATPATNYHFVNWTKGGVEVSTSATYSFTVTEGGSYTATFAINEYRIDSIRLTWQVKIGDGDPFFPTPYVTVNPTEADTMGYVMIPVGSECFIIPSEEQKPLIKKLELIPTGKFTVNSNGKQVFFAPGNLQYQASTNTWRFAENQWDFVGDATNGNVYVGNVKSNNALIASDYSGWIDLFGWGTSGYNHGANCYQPYSTSTTYQDYYAYGSDSYNLYDQTGQADWGYAASTAYLGGHSDWFTLKAAEWEYVFNERSTTSGVRYAKAKVNGVNGIILLPDNWNTSYHSLTSTNTYDADYTTNNISSPDWTNDFEAHGAVFLPAVGGRAGTSLDNVGYEGNYWSSSHHTTINSSYRMFFNSNSLDPQGNNVRNVGYSIRLVRDAN